MPGIPSARVALPVPVRKCFSYRIPPHLEEACRVGVRVVVPFGRRKLPGLVVSLETANTGEAEALRPLESVLDPAPLLDPELLGFTRWVADYYFAPWGQVIQAALPAALQSRSRRKVALTPSGGEVLENPFSQVRGVQWRILDLLARKGPMDEDRVRRVVPDASSRRLEGLRQKQWIQTISEELLPESRPRREEWCRLVGEGRLSGSRRSASQERAMEILAASGGRLQTAELRRLADVSRSTLATLARSGTVVLEARAAERVLDDLRPEGSSAAPALTPDQHQAAEAVLSALEEGGYRAFLLEGVTGSGKTEVYLAAAAAALERGRGVLYLVPEIGLTPLLSRRLAARFPGRVSLLHSGLSEADRRRQWNRIRTGQGDLVLGTRSAVFAPHPRLGLIVVDEEQDSSYFQSESPRYNGRDAALVRAKGLGIPAILGSATPSVEAVAAVERGKLGWLRLPRRIRERPLPQIRLIDMREEFRATGVPALLSRELVGALREIRSAGDQALFLLNRRGFATFVLCRACGEILNCPRCNISLTLHRPPPGLQCHACAYRRRLPSRCPTCRSPHLHEGGAGTQRLEEAIRIVEPGLRIVRMDRDTVKGRRHASLLTRFERREFDLLLGTQMVAKGHDFPGVTLVGVISADAYLGLPDFRAAERTYQLLTQVSGRAGRGERSGQVLIQAFGTQHYAIQAVATGNARDFYQRELRLRKLMRYPPWVALTQIRVKDTRAGRGEEAARRVAGELRSASGDRFEVLGPALSPLPRIRGEYRFQILLKGKSRRALADGVGEALEALEAKGELPRKLVVETDPLSLL